MAVLDNLLLGLKEIIFAPAKDASIWWLLTPIIFFWLIIEIYFGRYKTEKLGWNTALGNGLSMFWVVIISSKSLFNMDLGLFSFDKAIFIFVIAFYALFIIFISFTHKIKESVFFLFASPSAIYYLSAIAVLWIHNLLTITRWVMIDLMLLYVFVLIFETILKKMIPTAIHEKPESFDLGRV
ncbi:hypothetical protein ISS07_01120 [Candidatus Woesearchaeota archaeon]|nr:hypothetical protein [Candidatus Woesearchaeota archaeon]